VGHGVRKSYSPFTVRAFDRTPALLRAKGIHGPGNGRLNSVSIVGARAHRGRFPRLLSSIPDPGEGLRGLADSQADPCCQSGHMTATRPRDLPGTTRMQSGRPEPDCAADRHRHRRHGRSPRVRGRQQLGGAWGRTDTTDTTHRLVRSCTGSTPHAPLAGLAGPPGQHHPLSPFRGLSSVRAHSLSPPTPPTAPMVPSGGRPNDACACG
jgi:hypothetical protein